MLKKISLYFIIFNVLSGVFASQEELQNWTRASIILQTWDRADIIKLAVQICNLTEILDTKKAPKKFYKDNQHKRENESIETHTKRLFINKLLCNVGFEGAMFLLASPGHLEFFFAGLDEDYKAPSYLFRREPKAFILNTFNDLKTSVSKGQIGSMLWFLSSANTCDDNWQSGFSSTFLQYCNAHGFDNVAKFILHKRVFFFKGSPRIQERLRLWQGQCFAGAFLYDLEHSKHSGLEMEENFDIFKRFSLSQNLVDALYDKFLNLRKYEFMDQIVFHESWPKPSLEMENRALKILLSCQQYDRVRWIFTQKPGKKPSQEILDSHVIDFAKDKSWWKIDSILDEVFGINETNQRAKLPISKNLTDTLYVLAAAYENMEYLDLLTSESWGMPLSQQAKNEAFSFVCMNEDLSLIGQLARETTSAGFDEGLLKTVKYRYQDAFDRLLDSYPERFTDGGMHKALEQAGRPSERDVTGGIFRFQDISSPFLENHYQTRLRRILGIRSPMEILLNFKLPEITIMPIDFSNLYIPIDAVCEQISDDAEELNPNIVDNQG